MNTTYSTFMSNGIELKARFHDAGNHGPVVMFLTGDGPKGAKSLSWVNIPPMLDELGISSFLFDFEGLGDSSGERSILTLSRGRINFRDAFQHMKSLVGDRTIGFFASSFGAAVALEEPAILGQGRAIAFKSPAPWLADAYVNELNKDELDQWYETGYSHRNGYGIEVLADALLSNAYVNARTLTMPCMTTHGTADAIVPWTQSANLRLCWAGPFQLDLFDGVGHGYSEGDAWIRMATSLTSWLDQVLQDHSLAS